MSNIAAKVLELKESFKEKTPKQMRTIRNNLNNRIRSFEDEIRFGKSLPKISASHMFYELELKECKELLDYAMKIIKGHEKEK